MQEQASNSPPIGADSLDIMARTVFGEARGEPLAGQIAVAHVILNRARRPCWWGTDVRTACLKPEQFSCWNQDDPNRDLARDATLRDPHFQRAFAAACLAACGEHPDPTGGATHYHADHVRPSWASKMTCTARIGRHAFYR